MTIYILLTLSALCFLTGTGVFVVQGYKMSRGLVVVDEGFNGPEQLSRTLFAILRILSRRINLIRRLAGVYVLHFFVLMFRLFDRITSYFYARSRNLFVKSAIKNKGTAPHFWEYLKTYKQEIDREKEENE